MDFKNYLNTKQGLTQDKKAGTTSLKLGGALLLSLAAVQTEAQVIITNVAPANQVLTNGVYPVDVDGAGGAEFNISVNINAINFGSPAAGVQVQRSGNASLGYPYQLGAGALVNSAGGMQAPGASANSLTFLGGSTFSSYAYGNWLDNSATSYIGFQFNIGTNVHFGWIELSVVDATPGPRSVTITGWAYEATPNTPITTPLSPLPVNLTSFTAIGVQGINKLAWATAQEENSKGFEVQKSTDGKSFEQIGFVASAGNSTFEQTYNFTDADITTNTNYYRLKAIDLDNQFGLSEIVKVIAQSGKTNDIQLRTNPVRNGQLSFNYQAIEKGTLSINIFDLNGKVIHEQTAIANEGLTSFDINLSTMPAGIYYLKCEHNNNMSYEKIVVK